MTSRAHRTVVSFNDVIEELSAGAERTLLDIHRRMCAELETKADPVDVPLPGYLDYVVASVGMIPGTLLYVYYGKLAGDVAALAGGVASERGPADYALLAVGLVATILVTLFVTRLAKKALSQATGE